MLGVYYPGQAYPGRAPNYPATLYIPSNVWRWRVALDYRVYAVPRESRRYAVASESRTFSVARESRTFAVPRDPRVVDTER